MRIFVTGGAGFIGSALVRHLIANTAHEVLNFDKLTYAGTLSTVERVATSNRYRFVQGDICDAEAAALSNCRFQSRTSSRIWRPKAMSTARSTAPAPSSRPTSSAPSRCCEARAYWQGLDEAAKRAFRFHHISTDEVYGSLGDDGLFTEETPYDPRSPYSASKAGSDHLVSRLGAYLWPAGADHQLLEQLRALSFPRKADPADDPQRARWRAAAGLRQGRSGPRLALCRGSRPRAAGVFERGEPGRTYNVGGHNEKQNIEVVQTVCAILDRLRPRADGRSYAEQITYVADRPGHDKRYAIDATRINDELGWQPQETFESGIEKTVAWYLDNEEWWRPIVAEHQAAQRRGLAA